RAFVLQNICEEAGQCNASAGRCESCPATGRGPDMVFVGSSCIDATEVTNAQYQAFLDSNPSMMLQTPRCLFNGSFAPNPAPAPGLDNYPVVNVDWCDARAFCLWAGKRLCGRIGGGSVPPAEFADPTVSQWHEACVSGVANHNFPYGAFYDPDACNGADYYHDYAPVAVGSISTCRSPVAPYNNVFDLSGNVDEWEDSCEQVAMGLGGQDLCRSRGGSFADPVGFLGCAADWLGYQRNETNEYLGFR